MNEFHALSWLHLVSALAGIALISVVCGMSIRRPTNERLVRRGWMVGIVLVQGFSVVWYLTRRPIDWSIALPLQVCDLAGWLGLIALATRQRVWQTTLFYWAVGLSTQAFLTPTVHEGPAHLKFWLFWATHTQIIGSAAYDCFVLKYRPAWRDYFMGMASIVIYFLLVLPVNLAAGWNYGYVGNGSPGASTIVDVLGPWPLRLVWMFFIVAGLFALITVPFVLLRRSRSLAPHPHPSPRASETGA